MLKRHRHTFITLILAEVTRVTENATFRKNCEQLVLNHGEQARVFVVQLGRLITRVTGDVRETDFLRQRLSIAIQRRNALAIRGSLGLHKDCEGRGD